MKYDSAKDTFRHIAEVRSRLMAVVAELHRRASDHDQSKLADPEKAIFDEFTPVLAETTYGSPEYQACLKAMEVGLDHHYAVNRHHPEFHEHGIADMNLVDLIEMLADWKAATLRHDDGDLAKSIVLNRERFGFGEEIELLLINTAEAMGWL